MPYTNRNRRAPQTVPVELARQLVEERDALAERAQRAQRENQRLRSLVEDVEGRVGRERDLAEAAADEAEMLRGKLADVRRERDALRGELESRVEAPVETPEPDTEIIDALKRRIASLTDDVERAHRRTEKQVDNARQSERGRLLAGLGDVLDSVERALSSEELDGPWRAGLQAIESQLVTFIGAEGAELTGSVGEMMDPRVHEAIGTREVEGASRGEIVDVYRRGIQLEDGSIARAAQVIVAS